MQKIKDLIIFVLISAAFFVLLASDKNSFQDDYSRLKKDVEVVVGKGAPGRLLVYGENSFPILTGWEKENQQIVSAASKFKRGRVVALTHESFLDISNPSNKIFLKNCFYWFGVKDDQQAKIAANVKSLSNKLSEGFEVKYGKAHELKNIDIWIINSHKLKSNKEVSALVEHVEQGGGLLITGLGWAWKAYMSEGRSLETDFLGNKLMHHFGMAFVSGITHAKAKSEFEFSDMVPMHLHLNEQFNYLKGLSDHTSGPSIDVINSELEAAIQDLPIGRGVKWMDDFSQWLEKESGIAGYDFSKPIKANQPVKRLQVLMELEQQKMSNPRDLKAHPSYKVFPGEVKDQDAKRVTVEIECSPNQKGWISTGLYAQAGEPLVVKIPRELVGRVECRLGAHKDTLFHLDTWKRMPEITSMTKLEKMETDLCTAYGGLIYLEFSRKLDLPVQKITFSNVLKAPLYIAGKTTLEQWNQDLKVAPAPWGEIASDKMIVTVPSESLRNLDRPDQLMNTWDKIMDLCAELAQIPKDRERPERIVCDTQISAGYMHSGYPIMTWMDQKTNLVDRQHLLNGNWGFVHELGHNHQEKAWTFNGTGEVTCNLFSLYVFENLCGISPQTYERTSGKIRNLRVNKYLKKPDFELWKSNPWLALDMYVMLQKEFGWQPFKNIFSDYEDMRSSELPKTNQERMDQWMIRFSNEVERDLSSFFLAWGFPLSEHAIESVSHLNVWNAPEVDAILN